MTIELQKQTLSNNCVSACLAMILDIPVQQVTKEYHKDYHSGTETPMYYLKRYNVVTQRSNDYFQQVYEDQVAMLIVPSLGMNKGILHAILVDTRNNEVKIYDPALEGSLLYGQDYDIGAFKVDFVVTHSPAIGIYNAPE